MYLHLSIGRPRTCDGITLFPAYNHHSPAPPYLTGRRAYAMGVLVVEERPGAAAVPELVVRNDADLPVLLVEGETVLGNLQHRTFNVSVLCPPHAEVVVPVSCLERGRWGSTQPSTHSPHHSPLRLRELKTASVGEAVLSGRGKVSDQLGVWREVARHLEARDVGSPTWALEDVYSAATDVSIPRFAGQVGSELEPTVAEASIAGSVIPPALIAGL